MEEFCRDRLLELPVTMFQLFTCSMCYKYLIYTGNQLQPSFRPLGTLIPVNGTHMYPDNFSIIADVTNATLRDFVCRTLNDDDCYRWTSCCFSAIKCCARQLSIAKRNKSNELYCPRTWDGFACFDDTNVSSRAQIYCPSYVEHASTSEKAYKDCTENGTWWVNPGNRMEWTNYTTCIIKESHRACSYNGTYYSKHSVFLTLMFNTFIIPITFVVSVFIPYIEFHTVTYVTTACNIISLGLLIPACAIFIIFRQLRVQNRIRLHLCLFLSFVLTSCVTVIWESAIYMDRLNNSSENSIMHRNSGGCIFLYILLRYSSTSNFFWMFCEGFYLHRFIVHAFSPPQTLVPYYIFGWVGSCVPVVIYSIVRSAIKNYNTSCWVHNVGAFEWLLYIPNLICIAGNLVLLANILRILISQLQVHPNEPSNYRKALKATFVLVPLFGLTQFLVIYRPKPGLFGYEIASTIISNTQGAVVAVIFCFANKEVHSHLLSCMSRRIYRVGWYSFHNGSMSSATQPNQISSYDRGKGITSFSVRRYIPLSTSNTANDVTGKNTEENGHTNIST